jgi:hypothetical protein
MSITEKTGRFTQISARVIASPVQTVWICAIDLTRGVSKDKEGSKRGKKGKRGKKSFFASFALLASFASISSPIAQVE